MGGIVNAWNMGRIHDRDIRTAVGYRHAKLVWALLSFAILTGRGQLIHNPPQAFCGPATLCCFSEPLAAVVVARCFRLNSYKGHVHKNYNTKKA